MMKKVSTVAYAYDLAIVVSARNTHYLQTKTTEAISTVIKWLERASFVGNEE